MCQSSSAGCQPSVAERLGHMDAPDLLRAGQVGDGPRYAQHPGLAARGQAHRFGSLQQQLAARLVGRRMRFQCIALELGI